MVPQNTCTWLCGGPWSAHGLPPEPDVYTSEILQTELNPCQKCWSPSLSLMHFLTFTCELSWKPTSRGLSHDPAWFPYLSSVLSMVAFCHSLSLCQWSKIRTSLADTESASGATFQDVASTNHQLVNCIIQKLVLSTRHVIPSLQSLSLSSILIPII